MKEMGTGSAFPILLSFQFRLLVYGCRLQLLECPAELVGTGGALAATAYAVEARDDVIDMLSAHQLADALQVATASAQEEDLLDDVVLVGRHVNEL